MEKSTIDTLKLRDMMTVPEPPSPMAGEDEMAEGRQYADIAPLLEGMSRLQCYQLGAMHGAQALVGQIWHKESEHPDNKHPYPVLNPDGKWHLPTTTSCAAGNSTGTLSTAPTCFGST